MPRLSKSLALTAIAGIALALDACVIAPPQNYPPGQGYSPAAPVDVSDLYNSAANYAKQQLRARGFTQVGQAQSGQFHNTWWQNPNTHQCFQLEASGGQAMSLNAVSAAQCRPNAGAAGQPSNALTRNAETACMSAVNSQYGGQVNEVKVVRAEFSQANTEVIVDAVGVRGGLTTERWRCLASNSGQVADLSVMQ